MPSHSGRSKAPRAVSSALGRLGTGLMAAAWLTALVVVPLFFNPRTERVFDPDKIAWVTLLGLLGAVGLLLRATEPPVTLQVSRHPLVWSIGLAIAALALGALTSHVPAVSWWGLYRRGLGVIVYAALASLCACTAVTARRPGMLAMWIKMTIIVNVPVSMYVLFQRLGVDNIVWTGAGLDPLVRPFGSMGNPIFVGAYLVMSLPVVVAGLLGATRAMRRGEAGGRAQLIVAGTSAALGLAALIATQSRGPMLALFAGATMWALLWTAAHRRKGLAASAVVAVAVALAALLIVGRTEADGGARLAGMLATGSRTAQERLLVWGALGDLARSNPTRAIIGYGPETVGFVLAPHVPDRLARLAPNQVFDRAHNIVLEWWVSAGAMGVLALAALYVTAFVALVSRIGLAPRRADRVRLATAMSVGAALGSALPVLLGRGVYAPVGGPFGLLAGLGTFLLWATTRSPDAADAPRVASPDRWIAIALASALAAHLVETTVGLPTAVGELLFWTYLGLIVTMAASPGRMPDRVPDRAPSRVPDRMPDRVPSRAPSRVPSRVPDRQPSRDRDTDAPSAAERSALVTAEGALGGLALATVVFAPVLVPSRPGPFGSPWLWFLPAAVWVVAEALGADAARSRRAIAARLGVPAVLVVALMALEHTVGGAVVAYALTVITCALLVGRLLAGDLRDRSAGEPWRWIVVASMVLVASVAAWRLALAPVVADAHVRAGLEAVARRDPQGALDHFTTASAIWPRQSAYATYVSAAYRDQAVDPTLSDEARETAFRAAEAALAGAYARVPEVALVRRLGTLYRDRADGETDPDARLTYLAKSQEHLDLALEAWPTNATTIAEIAATRERSGDAAAARALYERAVDLGGADPAWLVGHARTALTLGDPEAAEASLVSALALAPERSDAVGSLVDEGAHLGVPLPGAVLSQVMVLVLTDRTPEARRLYAAIVEQAPATPGREALGGWLEDR